MPEQINSVAGQLVGIPVGQVYTAGKGVVIDNVNKTVRIDETVLFDIPVGSTPTTSVTLSENAFNFERLRIVYGLDSNTVSDSRPDYTAESELYLRPTISQYQIGATVYNWGSGNPLQIWGAGLTISGTSIAVTIALRRWWNQNASDSMKPYIYKVVGINRIAGGN